MKMDRRTFLAAGVFNLAVLPSFAKALPMTTSCLSILELRQYTLKKGRRDELISLFEREFVEPLNEAGAYVLGTYRDLDDPDRFVWLRGFETMPKRAQSLTEFYYGPVWSTHRNAANDTMVDSDNVLLLRPTYDLWKQDTQRAQTEAPLVTASIYYLGGVHTDAFTAFFEATLRPQIVSLGARPFATLVTEASANNFPALPVRDQEHAFIWLGAWDNDEAFNAFRSGFAAMSGWRDKATEELMPALMRKPELLRLRHTAAAGISE